ncbi:hypothetical protein J0A68_10690 [Algoriphagus sp. H41]|uniref:Calx-beta domain-containing protein n=1 Tax=Algoriphagus oliviformis TaxID=2811231 RepID=A0ABS3C499_9BACT|nr:hypothetical protein [Algoriphagus oliviformis]MBN7811424.1 hypothetical protein [Algoriphagus oliviformis]
MKLNKIYIFLATILASLSLTGCFDDQGDDTLLQGTFVEFEDGRLPNGRTASFVRLSANQTDVVELQINRVSTNSSSPITVEVSVDPTSTAVRGVHYEFSGASVTIPAGEFTGMVPVTVLTGNIDPSETPDLVLKMTTASGAEVSTNYGDLLLAIRVICSSELAGTYKVFWEYLQLGDGEGGADQSTTNFVISAADQVVLSNAGTGVYQVNDISFGLYPGLYDDTAPIGKISDACGEITGDPANADRYQDPFTINGMINQDGTISITWSNTWGDAGDVVLTKQ